jgi:hypothetical protein
LIITELSHLGIAMSADTAETTESLNSRGVTEDRAFFGLVKLLPVRKLQAGLSYWGWAKVPPSSANGVWMDWWLSSFIENKRPNYDTIEDLALLLESELRNVVPPLDQKELDIMPYGSGGIHLAGFVDEKGEKTPCFWHIHNGASQQLPNKKLDPSVVNANYDCPSSKFLEYRNKSQAMVIRNGDTEAYIRFFDKYLRLSV